MWIVFAAPTSFSMSDQAAGEFTKGIQFVWPDGHGVKMHDLSAFEDEDHVAASPRRTCAAALGALAIFHSLPALQLGRSCTQSRHPIQPSRRCCIPSQYRRPGMTPPAPPTVNALPPRVAAAACRYALGLRPLLHPYFTYQKLAERGSN